MPAPASSPDILDPVSGEATGPTAAMRPGGSAASRQDDSLVTRVRLELRRQLLAASYPVWERLAEARLATQLGVSRTPVREALRQLEREELVVVDDSGSYRPRIPVVTHIQNLYAVRAQLEEMSVTLACAATRDDARLDALAKEWKAVAIDDETDPEYVYIEESFHIGLAEVGGNGALVEILSSINDRIRLARSFSFNDPAKRGFSVREHRQIIRIVHQRDADLGRTRIRRHITESAAMVETSVNQALARMVDSVPGLG